MPRAVSHEAAQEAGLFAEAATPTEMITLFTDRSSVHLRFGICKKVDAFRNCVSLVAVVAPSSESESQSPHA